MSDKIIIHNHSDLPLIDAMLFARLVMNDGECSIGTYGKQYAFVTQFQNGILVYADKRKTGTHVFKVYSGKAPDESKN